MGRKVEPPRLQVYRRKGRPPVFMIRHRGKRFSTGTGDRAAAEAKLAKFIADPKRFQFAQGRSRSRTDPKRTVWLYFVEVLAEDRPVKIGIADDVRARIWNIGVGSPFDLKLLAAVEIERIVEKVLHKHLETSRIRGEWYRRTPEIEAAISAALAGAFDEFVAPLLHAVAAEVARERKARRRRQMFAKVALRNKAA